MEGQWPDMRRSSGFGLRAYDRRVRGVENETASVYRVSVFIRSAKITKAPLRVDRESKANKRNKACKEERRRLKQGQREEEDSLVVLRSGREASHLLIDCLGQSHKLMHVWLGTETTRKAENKDKDGREAVKSASLGSWCSGADDLARCSGSSCPWRRAARRLSGKKSRRFLRAWHLYACIRPGSSQRCWFALTHNTNSSKDALLLLC